MNSAFFRINPASRSFRLFGERRVIVLGMEWSRWCADWPILWLWRNAARDLVVLHLTAVTHYHGACLRRKMLNFLISPLFFFFSPSLLCSWDVDERYCLLLKLGWNVYLGRCKKCVYLLCFPSVISAVWKLCSSVSCFVAALLPCVFVRKKGLFPKKWPMCFPRWSNPTSPKTIRRLNVWLCVQTCVCITSGLYLSEVL